MLSLLVFAGSYWSQLTIHPANRSPAIKQHPIIFLGPAESFHHSRGPDGSLPPTCPEHHLRDGLELVIRQHIQHGTSQTSTVKIPLDPTIQSPDFFPFFFLLTCQLSYFWSFVSRQKREGSILGCFTSFIGVCRHLLWAAHCTLFRRYPAQGGGRWWHLGEDWDDKMLFLFPIAFFYLRWTCLHSSLLLYCHVVNKNMHKVSGWAAPQLWAAGRRLQRAVRLFGHTFVQSKSIFSHFSRFCLSEGGTYFTRTVTQDVKINTAMSKVATQPKFISVWMRVENNTTNNAWGASRGGAHRNQSN